MIIAYFCPQGDDSRSASELRQRYHRGGSVPDSALSASQLRARYGVQSNKPDFSTSQSGSKSTDMMVLVGGGFAVVVVLYLAASFIMG